MKKFVQIGSTQNIFVTPDLRSINATNLKSPVANRLSVKPAWSRMKVLIKAGSGWYPAEMKTWKAVKTYADLGIFTIGAEADTCPNQAEVEEICKKLSIASKRYADDIKRNNDILGKSTQAQNQM